MTYKHKDHMEWLLQKTDYYTENAVTEERIQEIKEVYAKAKAWDELYAEFDKGDKDLSIADFNEVLERYKVRDSETDKEIADVFFTPAYQTYFSAGDESEAFCGNCETYLEDDFKYCPTCGLKLDWEGAYGGYLP